MKGFEQQGRVDKLETLILSLEQSRYTGTVNIMRGKGGVSEKGDIIFLRGDAVDAHTTGRIGVDAFQWLMTWGNCQYTLIAQSPDEIVVPPPQQPSVPETPSSPFSFIMQVLPPNLLATKNVEPERELPPPEYRPAGLPPPSVTVRPSVPSTQPMQPMQPVPPMTPPMQITAQTPATSSRRNPEPYPQEPFAARNQPPAYQQNATPARQEQHMIRVPCRSMDAPQALGLMGMLNMPRVHRHIFLLLDGQRTENDLVRLTKHTLGEIKLLLSDLERAGIIQYQMKPEGAIQKNSYPGV